MALLPDVSVWIAAVAAGHVHHRLARAWMDAQQETLAFCRVTQLGMLRHLSNHAVMHGDVVTRRRAWEIFHELMRDDRVRMLPEPDRLESLWAVLSGRDDHSHRLWTDDYLLAFAQAAGATFVTLDGGIEARYPSVAVLTLR